MVYDSINRAVLEQVPRTTKSILDLGCGAGSMGEALRGLLGCSVVGVTSDPEEAIIARTRLSEVHVRDLNSFNPASLGVFDCIICAHVLEHLYWPENLLTNVRACLVAGGTLIVALPNILFWKQRLDFLRGRFTYTDGGIIDRTHYRFYDWPSAQKLLAEAGYAVTARVADGGFPMSRLLGRGARHLLDRIALTLSPGLFAWQFVFRCTPLQEIAESLDQHAS